MLEIAQAKKTGQEPKRDIGAREADRDDGAAKQAARVALGEQGCAEQRLERCCAQQQPGLEQRRTRIERSAAQPVGVLEGLKLAPRFMRPASRLRPVVRQPPRRLLQRQACVERWAGEVLRRGRERAHAPLRIGLGEAARLIDPGALGGDRFDDSQLGG